MRIIQNILSPIPEKLIPCIQSVKDWAGEYYVEVNTIPLDLKHISDLRIVSNILRIRQLADVPQTWVIDWDVFIQNLNRVHDIPKFYFHPDCCIYNGNDTDLFKSILGIMKPTIQGINNAIRILTLQGKVSKQNVLPFNSIKHLSWSKL